MRSRSAPGLPGRCPRCWIREPYCICAELPTVVTGFEISILRHVKESFKTTNTARIAALALPSARIVDLGGRAPPPPGPSEPLGEGTFLLFPSRAPTAVDPGRVRRLVVLDGTWSQARSMFRRLPGLGALPTLSVAQTHHPALRLRTMPSAGALSTLEAIAAAVGLLEGAQKAELLYRLHDRFVERVLKARGTLKVALG